MPTAQSPRRFEITSLGAAARRALDDGADGHVLAVFRRSFYVEMADGHLVCVGALGLGDGPLNTRAALPETLDFEAAGMTPGQPVAVTGTTLNVGGAFAFDLAGAETWRPPGPVEDVSCDDLRKGLADLRRAAGTVSHDIGLGRLIADPELRPDEDDAFLWRAAAAIGPMTDWIARNLAAPEDDTPPAEAEGLIGLGPGLTPSGDDWIGGAMIALGVLRHPETALLLARWVLPLAQQRTGKISIAHLACAASGHGAAALHAAIQAVASNDTPALAAAVDDVDTIGHTSGWDALAGAAAVISSCSGPRS